MKDLVINNPATKKKRSKRQKKETTTETTESVGENQPVWLDSLKEELAKLKWALNTIEYISTIFGQMIAEVRKL